MKFIIFLSIAVYSIQSLPTQEAEWETFKITYNKRYASLQEEKLRKELFFKKLQLVEDHNEKYKQRLVSYEIGINKFSDYTEEERLSLKHPLNIRTSNKTFTPKKNFLQPDSKDWREEGAVSPVEDQGTACESSWAFSVINALESQYYIQKKQEVFLSTQQVVDCTYDKKGCWGGWMDDAYNYIIKNGGVNEEKDYPYEASDVGGCRYHPDKSHYTLTSFVNIERGSEPDLQAAIAEIGPVAVAVDTSGNFDDYKSGVYYNPNCDPNLLTHALLVVGYGTEDDQDYWLLKNFYSEEWGDHGYIKIARFMNNHCGIATAASYPIL